MDVERKEDRGPTASSLGASWQITAHDLLFSHWGLLATNFKAPELKSKLSEQDLEAATGCMLETCDESKFNHKSKLFVIHDPIVSTMRWLPRTTSMIVM